MVKPERSTSSFTFHVLRFPPRLQALHFFLMQVNPANVLKFKDVTRYLEEEVKRLEAGGKA